MQIRVPPKRIRKRFLIIYELEGCQKAVDYLTDYYAVKRMKIVLDGKRVGKRKTNQWVACYSNNKAFFTKKGLTKRIVLHELYHHLVESKGYRLQNIVEEKEAIAYAKDFLRETHAISCIR